MAVSSAPPAVAADVWTPIAAAESGVPVIDVCAVVDVVTVAGVVTVVGAWAAGITGVASFVLPPTEDSIAANCLFVFCPVGAASEPPAAKTELALLVEISKEPKAIAEIFAYSRD